ncbi:MAG: hypothetical protein ABI690_16205 [Chloroflexota bacterium]
MSYQHPMMLYVGAAAQGRAFFDAAESRGSWVYLAEDAAEALGAYVAYSPDAVILDPVRAPDMAADVYHHLHSVGARALFILSPDRDWDVSLREDDDVYVIRPDAAPDDLFDMVVAALEPIELHPAYMY